MYAWPRSGDGQRVTGCQDRLSDSTSLWAAMTAAVSAQVPTLRNKLRQPHCEELRSIDVEHPTLRHRDDDIASFLTTFDVPVGLDDLLQRVAAIDDRFQLPRLDELFEINQIACAARVRTVPPS